LPLPASVRNPSQPAFRVRFRPSHKIDKSQPEPHLIAHLPFEVAEQGPSHGALHFATFFQRIKMRQKVVAQESDPFTRRRAWIIGVCSAVLSD
jgi:hypothetical protein